MALGEESSALRTNSEDSVEIIEDQSSRSWYASFASGFGAGNSGSTRSRSGVSALEGSARIRVLCIRGRPAGNQGHVNQLGERVRAHFLHHPRAMDLDRPLADSEFM